MAVLTLFLSGGKSLGSWQRDGVLSREMQLYRSLLRRGVFERIQIFSYDAADRQFVRELAQSDPLYARVDILAPQRGKGSALWGIAGAFACRKALSQSDALKTNQTSGGWAALLASWLARKPLIYRMGYILSRRFALNGQRLKAGVARMLESALAARASRIVVSSADAASYFRARPAAHAAKVVHLPSYVDTSAFTGKSDYDFAAPAITVARLRPQKNLIELLKGCAEAGCDLVLVGQGDQESELRALAQTLPIKVEFVPLLENSELAARLREHTLFLLPSLHEGLPKALIEAMAVGLICIGTPIPGITDLIADGETGYLTEGMDAAAVTRAIERARREASPELGRRARALAEERYGLERYVDAEASLYRELMA